MPSATENDHKSCRRQSCTKLCDGNKALAETVHLPLINGKARVLAKDFEGRSAVIQVIDTVLLPDDNSSSIGVDSGSPVRSETANGLNTTTFDTLVGTVTVNLPDDLAASDTISGTVIAEVKKSEDKDQAPRDLDELSGYVIEVAEQKTPMKKTDGNQIDFCKSPDEKTNLNLIDFCKSWTVPDIATSIPIVLKNKAGAVVGRADIPVAPKAAFPVKMEDAKYSTPAIGQAGKPISVKGQMGNFEDTAIKIGNQAAKFLASSPRKMVVESPRDLKGVNDIEVEYKGKTVAKCTYRSVSIRLAAAKLNLIKGEQTNLTVTLAGLIGLLSPVSFQLSNKSPGTVSMSGGETQTVVVSPRDVNGDNFETKRTLTGVKAGGFSISAILDPAPSGQINCGGGGTPNDIPITPVPQPSPGDNPNPTPNVDADGNPRTNDGPGRQVDPMRGRYRVTLNGFKVHHVTNHGLFQRPDAVTFQPEILTVTAGGEVRPTLHGGNTNTIGSSEWPVDGGSAPGGGFLTGDGFPTQETPWRRIVAFNRGIATIPPTIYFENEIVQNTNAIVIIPSIWSVDGQSNLRLRENYLDALVLPRAALGSAVASTITRPPGRSLTNFLRPGAAMGIGNTVSLAIGVPQNRPVGMQPVGSQFGYTPQVLVLTYESAEFISGTDFGFGNGIVPVRYVDHASFGGDYEMYFQVERLANCPEPLLGASVTGPAELTTTHSRARGPFHANINLTVNLTECRGIIAITNFPPIVTDPFSIELPDGRILQNRTTVTQTGGGTGTRDPATGRITIPITLHFQHSVEAELFPLAEPSDLNLVLTTDASGGRRLSSGSFILVGSRQFIGGFLGGTTGTLIVNGTFSPRP